MTYPFSRCVASVVWPWFTVGVTVWTIITFNGNIMNWPLVLIAILTWHGRLQGRRNGREMLRIHAIFCIGLKCLADPEGISAR